MLANWQQCRQNADQPEAPPRTTQPHTHMASPPPEAFPCASPLPHTAANHPQVGIGPEALPERKKPSLGG